MRLSEARELYRRAELRLRTLLFGDSVYGAGRLRGEEPRQQAAVELRRMRSVFDEVLNEAKESEQRADLAEDLLDEARGHATPQEKEGLSSRPQEPNGSEQGANTRGGDDA